MIATYFPHIPIIISFFIRVISFAFKPYIAIITDIISIPVQRPCIHPYTISRITMRIIINFAVDDLLYVWLLIYRINTLKYSKHVTIQLRQITDNILHITFLRW